MRRSGRAVLFLLRAWPLLLLAGLLAWPAPGHAAARAPGKRKPAATPHLRAGQGGGKASQLTKSSRPPARRRAKIRDARLAAVLAGGRAPLPVGIPGRAPSHRLSAPERQALEESLQEEIAAPEASAAIPQPPEAPLVWPLTGNLNSPFGPRRARFHAGIDIAGSQGDPVSAAADGRVLYARASRGPMGKTVVLEHADGLRTVYAHLSRLDAREGAMVRQGERIGAVGRTGRATGPHLHFEVRHQGRPVVPQAFLPGGADDAGPRLASAVRPPSPVPAIPAAPASVEAPGPPPAIDPAS